MSENTEISSQETISQSENTPNLEINEASNTLYAFIRFVRDLIILFIIAIAVRSFVVTPFQINGDSMNDNYFDREYILVNTFGYLDFSTHFNEFLSTNPDFITGGIAQILKKLPIHVGDPKRWDVIVLKPHVNVQREYYLKRIIGLPGEEIRIWWGQVYIKQKGSDKFVKLDEPYLSGINKGKTYIDGQEDVTFTIPEEHYWVMGDNRLRSTDSRQCFNSCDISGSTHFLAREDIVGKVSLSFGYFNIFDKTKKFPHLGTLSWEVPMRLWDTKKNAIYPELNQ